MITRPRDGHIQAPPASLLVERTEVLGEGPGGIMAISNAEEDDVPLTQGGKCGLKARGGKGADQLVLRILLVLDGLILQLIEFKLAAFPGWIARNDRVGFVLIGQPIRYDGQVQSHDGDGGQPDPFLDIWLGEMEQPVALA